jgi:2-methylaconitate cis-trans-isomerase PrpF
MMPAFGTMQIIKAATAVLVVVMTAAAIGIPTWRLQQEREAHAITKLEFETLRAESAQRIADAEAAARAAESKLRSSTHQIREKTNAQVRDLAVERDALAQRLRVAEARLAAASGAVSGSPGAPADGASASGGDGAELPAPIGAADVDEAYRADVIRLNLLACYEQYEQARKTLGAKP